MLRNTDVILTPNFSVILRHDGNSSGWSFIPPFTIRSLQRHIFGIVDQIVLTFAENRTGILPLQMFEENLHRLDIY